jgi:hypothetical protein
MSAVICYSVNGNAGMEKVYRFIFYCRTYVIIGFLFTFALLKNKVSNFLTCRVTIISLNRVQCWMDLSKLAKRVTS